MLLLKDKQLYKKVLLHITWIRVNFWLKMANNKMYSPRKTVFISQVCLASLFTKKQTRLKTKYIKNKVKGD